MTLTIGLFIRTSGLVPLSENGLADTAAVELMSAIAAAMMIFFMGSLLFRSEERCCSVMETPEDEVYSLGVKLFLIKV